MPRLIFRWGLVRHASLRAWLARRSGLPAPAIAAVVSVPAAQYYAHAIRADDAAVRPALAELPRSLDQADTRLAEGVLVTTPANAATLQVLSSVRALDAFADLHDHVASHPCAAAARELFPDYPSRCRVFCARTGLERWLQASRALLDRVDRRQSATVSSSRKSATSASQRSATNRTWSGWAL